MKRPTFYKPKGSGSPRAGLSLEKTDGGFRLSIQEQPQPGSQLRDGEGTWWTITGASGAPGNWLCDCTKSPAKGSE